MSDNNELASVQSLLEFHDIADNIDEIVMNESNNDEHNSITSDDRLVNNGSHQVNIEPDTITSNNHLETEIELENDSDASQQIVNEEE